MSAIEALKHPFILGEKLSKKVEKCTTPKRKETWHPLVLANSATTCPESQELCREQMNVEQKEVEADELEGRNYETLILSESPAYDTSEIQIEGNINVAERPRFERRKIPY